MLDLVHVLAGGQTGPVRDAEDVGVDGNRGLAEGGVEHHIGRLAADAGELHQFIPAIGNLAAVVIDKNLRERDHVLGLGIEQADGLDVVFEAFLAQFQHRLRRFHLGKQRTGRLVHANVRRLRAQGHRHEQLVGIAIFQLGLG